MKTIPSRVVLTVAVLALGGVGCAGADSAATGTAPTAAEDGHDEAHGDDGHGGDAGAGHGSTGAGGPAAAPDADRTIEVAANDDLSFDPSAIQVTAGEVITFVVTNTGDAPHEFILGDASTQQEHAAEMEQDRHGGHHGENAISIAPGATEELTWAFTDVGQVLYGCHVPGHYDGGMVGTVTVDG